MTELHPNLQTQKLIEEAKTNKVEHAQSWVEECLRQGDGPWDQSSAVIVITALPIKDDKGNFTGGANIQQALLPDMDFTILADALEGLAAKVRAHSERTDSEKAKPN